MDSIGIEEAFKHYGLARNEIEEKLVMLQHSLVETQEQERSIAKERNELILTGIASGMTRYRISKILGISEGAVQTLVSRARQKADNLNM